MLRQILTLFVVSLVLEMSMLYALAFAITLSAAIGHDVWQNTTNLMFSSPFEYYNIENHPKATLHTRHVPQTSKSVVSNSRATTAQHTTSALIATAPNPVTPKAPSYPLATSGTWPSPDATNAHDATGHTNDTGTNLDALMSTYPHSLANHITISTKFGGDVAKASGNASANHANPTSIIWTVPGNVTTTTTPTPTPRDTAFRQFINKINSVRPYLEACGILDIVWNVGKFVHARIKQFRGKRSGLPVVEVP